jgi:glucosamine-phosphate N-acetyltransferase
MEINYSNLLEFVLNNINNLTDIKNQYIILMNQLTTSSNILNEIFLENIKKIHLFGIIIIAWIELEDNKFELIGSGTIIIEPKIIRSGKSVGHIEDIVVKDNYRGNKISFNILNKLKEYGKNNNCYKVILDCDEKLEKFYELNNFKKKGIQMSEYF